MVHKDFKVNLSFDLAHYQIKVMIFLFFISLKQWITIPPLFSKTQNPKVMLNICTQKYTDKHIINTSIF
jgi:hypothetical protein